MKVRVKVNRRGIQEMAGADFMVREMARRGERVKRLGFLRSPFLTGRYSASWYMYAGTRRGIAFAEIGNRAPYAWFVERGTKNPDGSVRMAARHVVKEALAAASD